MKMSRDPLRWAESGADAPPALARDIRVLRAERASTMQLAALERRLIAELTVPTFARASSASAELGLGAKSLGSLVLACAVGLIALVAYVRQEAAPGRSNPLPRAPAASSRAAAPAPARAIAPQPRAASNSQSSEAAVVDAADFRPSRAADRERRRRSSAPAITPTPETELALLRRSQAALDGDPSAALDLAEQHARDYPRGLFAQEREVLAIEALLKLRRKPAAVDRAAHFVQRFPDSPHARRVRALLEHTPGGLSGAVPSRAADQAVRK